MEFSIKRKVMRKFCSSLLMLAAAVIIIIVSDLRVPENVSEEPSILVEANVLLSDYQQNLVKMPVELLVSGEKLESRVDDSLPAGNSVIETKALSQYSHLVFADVNESLNVRNQPSADGEIVGKMPKGSAGEIMESANDFTKIKSGEVEGWVANEYLIFGAQIEEKAKELGLLKAQVTTETLKIRKYADIEAPTVELCSVGDAFPVLEETGDWIKIRYSGEEIGYIAAEYASVNLQWVNAITLAEEQAAIKAAEQKAAAQKIKEASNEQERKLLAACVMMEAGGSYEGQLAVANVILNRVKSGRWGNTITDVIYAKGQFPGAASGLLNSYLEKGASSTALSAVQDAMNGVNNVGDYLYFNSAGRASYGSYREYVVIGGNCFYKK